MTQGWIKLHRSITTSDIWEDKPFSRAQAWIEMLLMANHKTNQLIFNGRPLTIERGQFITSSVKLSERWGWSRSKVNLFLDALETMQSIVQQKDNRKTTITICNYERYQGMENEKEQQKDSKPDSKKTAEEQQKDTNKNVKNENNEKNLLELAAPEKEIKDPLEEKVTLAPGLTMTRKQSKALIEEFGLEACRYYKPICSDWLLANGKRKKDAAAFMRNWIRKEQAERRGFYYPKKLPEAQRVFDTPRPTLRPQPRAFNGLGAKPERSEAERMEVRGLVSGLLEKIGGKTPH